MPTSCSATHYSWANGINHLQNSLVTATSRMIVPKAIMAETDVVMLRADPFESEDFSVSRGAFTFAWALTCIILRDAWRR